MKALIIGFAAVLLVLGWVQTVAPAATTVISSERPLLLEANQGEHRERRVPTKGAGSIVTSSFILQVDSHNGGTSNLMLMTDIIKPGAVIPRHRHLHQDEIVLVEHGTAHAVVGDQVGDVHDGGAIFIPHNTWVTIKNVGSTSIHVFAFFNGSDFDAYMRCASVPKGQKVTSITAPQRRACGKAGNYELWGL